MADLQNQILALRREVERLQNTNVVFNSEPRNPNTQTVYVNSTTGETKFWTGKEWVITTGGTLTSWNATVVFTATDYRTIAWTTGVVSIGTTTSKTDYATTSGNFTMAATTYFYWQADNPTAIQTTSTAGDVVIAGGVLIAVGRMNSDTANLASLKVFGGPSVDQIIADEIVANSITSNMLQANSITSAKLATTLLYAGAITLDTNGLIKGGQTDYDTGTGFFLGYSTSTYKFSVGNSAGNKLTWDGTTLSITGSLTATTGAIGGFTIGTDYIRDASDSFGLASTVTGSDDVRFWSGASFASRSSAPFRITEAGALTATSATITGALTTASGSVITTSYLSGTIAQTNLNLANRGWTQTSVFSVTDADTVSWGSGTLTSADGTAYSISAGNTGNMVAKTYIYLDIAVSTTAYQTTTTSSTAVGAGKILVAVAQNGTVEPTFTVMQGQGGQNIDAASIVAGSITANEIATSTITAANISTLNMTGKSCTFDTGTVGGWTLASTTLSATSGGNTTTLSSGSTAFAAGPTGSPSVTITQAGVLTATGAVINGYNLTSTGTFGGNGSDGVVTDANLTITGSNNTVITKQYSSWTAGTSARSFTVTPTGCILYIKIIGNADFTNWTFNFTSKGALGGADMVTGSSTLFGNTGGGGNDGSGGQGGGGGASSTTSGSAGGGGGGAGGVTIGFNVNLIALLKQYKIDCGSGGGGGESTLSYGGAGGNGGGCVIMEVSGNINLGSATFNFVGGNGSAGDPLNVSGGGGGGGGGYFLLLYNGTSTGTSTNNSNGGSGGTGATNSGGAGGNGAITIQKNTVFA